MDVVAAAGAQAQQLIVDGRLEAKGRVHTRRASHCTGVVQCAVLRDRDPTDVAVA